MGRLHCWCKLPVNANPARACKMSHFRLAPDKGPTCWVVSVSCHGNLCILVCLRKVSLLDDKTPRHLLMCTCHILFFFFLWLYTSKRWCKLALNNVIQNKTEHFSAKYMNPQSTVWTMKQGWDCYIMYMQQKTHIQSSFIHLLSS